MKLDIYADNAATMRPEPIALEEYVRVTNEFYANPSSAHSKGRAARKALESARNEIASCLGCKPSDVIFTSGGTESDSLALMGYFARRNYTGRLVTFAGEHKAVLNTAHKLDGLGVKVITLPSRTDGVVDISSLDSVLCDGALCSIMTANNETGAIMPVKQIAKKCHSRGAVFHTDAVQAAGHIKMDMKRDEIDMLSLSAHKFGGLRGTGALIVRGVGLSPVFQGGGQENGLRGGTENTAGVCAMSKALKASCEHIESDNAFSTSLRNDLITKLSEIADVRINSSKEHLSGIVSVSFKDVNSENLVSLLDLYGICASAGSACNTGKQNESHVLRAMNLPKEYLSGTVRFSFSKNNAPDDAKKIADVLKETIAKLRELAPKSTFKAY